MIAEDAPAPTGVEGPAGVDEPDGLVASDASRAPGAPGAPGAEDEPGASDRPWSWHLSRASAIALAVLLPVHLVSFHLVGDPLTYDRLLERWDTPWRLFDWATLVLGLVHGSLALQPELPGPPDPEAPDAATGPANGRATIVRRVAGRAALVAGAAMVGLLTYVVFSLGLTT